MNDNDIDDEQATQETKQLDEVDEVGLELLDEMPQKQMYLIEVLDEIENVVVLAENAYGMPDEVEVVELILHIDELVEELDDVEVEETD